MKTHTSDFKNTIKTFGRELDSKITYTIGGTTTELGNEQLNSVTPHYEGGILKSVMKQLDIDSNVEIPLGTILTYQFGVKVGNSYEYISYGNYVVKEVEKQEDTMSYKITCYDKMLYSMIPYEAMSITYPITIRNYISAICTKLGLTFKNSNSTFANYNKQITKELYLDSNGKDLGYTFRDVLDELAQVTASTICINETDDELEIRYINDTNDTIDEEFLKDVNVNFGEKFGAVNTIVLSRSAGADNIYYPSTLPANPIEIKISDNQIMNGNDRDTYMADIYSRLNGLEYYINDFSSTGICYYNLCDKYNVSIGGTTYSCIMFNDEVNVTQGLQENIYTDMPEESVTDYTKSDKTDRRINQTTLIVDKQQGEITALVDTTQNIQKEINPTDTATGSTIYLEDSAEAPLINFELEGKTTQETSASPVMPSPDYPSDIVSVGYKNLFDNQFRQGGASNLSTTNRLYSQNDIYVEQGKIYTISTNLDISIYRYAINIAIQPHPYSPQAQDSNWKIVSSFTFTANLSGYLGIPISKIANTDITLNDINGVWFQVVEGQKPHSYIPYGKYGVEVKTTGKNLFDGVLEQGSVNSQGINNTNTTRLRTKNYISVYPNTTYTLKVNENTTGKNLQFSISYYDKNDYTTYRLSYLNWTTSNPITFTTPNDCHYIRFLIAYTDSSTINTTDNISKIQVEKTQATTYEPYKSNTYLYTLNEPLRAIGNYKDNLYIDNGMLYVERKIGKVVLDGSETWTLSQTNNVFYMAFSETNFLISDNKPMSDYFIGTQNVGSASTMGAKDMNTIALSSSSVSNSRIYIKTNVVTTKNELTQWLSTHNTEVQYILAEPYTEEIGQVDIPSTYKGITHINTTDKLEPNMNITYVRNTQITNYVEEHISQIIVNEEGITQRVQTIEDSDYDSRINAVEQKQTATDLTIDIISTNIDKTNGEVRAVTTNTGFTFDENGLNIKKSDTDYNTLIDNTGTYYKDGETIISMTNKDGFLAKDFRLQGQHYYSYNANNPSEPLASENYDFVDERIEIEVDGQTQYAYATFYNGEV